MHYEVAKYFWNRGSRLLSCLTILGSNVWKTRENKQNFEKLTKLAMNFYLEDQKLRRIYDLRLDDFRKSETQGVEMELLIKETV